MSTIRMAVLCGDCGGEVVDNPAKGAGRTVTIELSPRSRIFNEITVYDKPAHLHADDLSPICTSHEAANRRKSRAS